MLLEHRGRAQQLDASKTERMYPRTELGQYDELVPDIVARKLQLIDGRVHS